MPLQAPKAPPFRLKGHNRRNTREKIGSIPDVVKNKTLPHEVAGKDASKITKLKGSHVGALQEKLLTLRRVRPKKQ